MAKRGTWKVAGLFVGLFAIGCAGAVDDSRQQESPPASPSAPEGVVSDRFALRWELDGGSLLLAVDTDLPDEGELSVSVSRSYFEVGSDEEYARDYLSMSQPVSRWREPRRISLNADAWRENLAAHQAQMEEIAPFEVATIADAVDIRVVLHTNQDDPRFGGQGNPNLSGTAIRVVLHTNQDDPRFGGQGNPNLSGTATSRVSSRVVVEAEASFEFPLEPVREVLVATTMTTTADLVSERVCLDQEGSHVLEAAAAASGNAAAGFLMLDDGSAEGEFVASAMRFAGQPRRVRSEEVVLHAGEPCYLVSAQGDRATTRLIRLLD